jgi:hypothetical protein
MEGENQGVWRESAMEIMTSEKESEWKDGDLHICSSFFTTKKDPPRWRIIRWRFFLPEKNNYPRHLALTYQRCFPRHKRIQNIASANKPSPFSVDQQVTVLRRLRSPISFV